MELDTDVWIKGKESKKNANDAPWSVGRVVSKDVDHDGLMTIIVRNENGDDFMFSSNKGGLDIEEIQLKNATSVNDVDNLIELPYLNEPEILHSLSTRYFQRKIYTYTGNILIAINPLQAIVPDDSCQGFLQHFTSEIKTLAVGLSDVSSTAATSTTEGDIKRHSIIITGESGSGKTECAKLLTMFMISAEVKSSKEFLGVQVAQEEQEDLTDEDEAEAGSEDDNVPSAFRRNISQDSMMCDSVKESTPLNTPSVKLQQSTSMKSFGGSPSKSVYFKAYQLSTMERIRQVTPILEAFGNACIVHTHNSSRLGKYAELSFTKRGQLVSGEIRTYLLENVRVIRQLAHERNFHVFYQLAAGASDADRERWALGDISSFHYANQGGKQALRNPLVNDRADFTRLKENFTSLGLESDIVESIFSIVAGILHLGQISFASVSQSEGQVAKVIDQCVQTGDRSETELMAAARLCAFSSEELQRSLTVRSVLLNKELFHKSLTPEQAVNSRDAVAKAVYKRLFTWLVQELNSKLRPTDSVPAEIASSVGVLDIFGFDSFTVNSFEQLCINYANEALQQHFAQHMFKLELLEYKREGIPFENIEFPDNQESLDLITTGLFTILDDQCRIPNATDKRYASQLYKELSNNPNFSANATQIGSNLFCVQHFAGPVVYTTDKFIEKNLDELPQDAANLLKNSRNPVLSAEILLNTTGSMSPTSGAGSLPKPPVMAAYVSKPKMEPGSRTPAARRGSLGGKSLYSVVAQLRDEVSVMMAHINTTVPHYVCCINPVERIEDGATHHASKGKSAQFHNHVVADQLRYGGILGAVKVARSGLPHRFSFLEFFRRYRSLANPLNPVSKKLVEHLTEKEGETKAKEQSELLLQALRNTSSTAVVVSAVQSRLAEEMQVILRKRSIRQWMGAIGGVINEGGFAVGHTKVFIGKQAHILLESCLYHQLALCRKKIGDLVLRRIHRNRFAHTQRVIRLIQRVARGALARIRARLLARRKAAGAEESESQKGSPTMEGLDAEVREVKRQDALIQEQIRRLVASNKATEEPEYLTLDIAATKQELLKNAAKFSASSVLSVKTIEASEHVGEGFELLRPDKIIPLTTVGKALSFGHNVKIKTRTNAVKFANKLVTKDHPVFKNLHKLMDRLRELFELAKLEKEVLENRKRNHSRGAMTPIPSPAPSISGRLSPPPPSANIDIADIDTKLATLDKIAKQARTIYQYFHQYILEMVKEYGPDSRYKAGFSDENQYLLAFVELVDRRKPMLCFETPSGSTPAAEGENGDSSTTNNFPLYIPSEKHQGPQHQGLLPLCTYGGVQFKVVPISHAPGVEYAVNTFHRLLQGRHLMYPIKFLKIIGKSGESKGKESFYQAATEFAQKNLESLDRATPIKLSVDDFSSMMICSVIFGAKVIHPHHLMADTSKTNTAEVSLGGVSCDSAFLSHLFKYKVSDAAHTEDLNVLYLMPQMDIPIPSAMVELLTRPGAAASLTSAWLRELTLQNKRFAALKSAGFTPADMTALSLPIVLPSHAGAQVHHMLTKVCKALQKASAAQQVLTHSDLLVSLESALAERYAELRIRYSEQPATTYRDLYDACHAERAASVKADPQIKSFLTVDVDHTTAEVLNTLDFSTLPDGSGSKYQEDFSALFDNFSFLPSLHLRNISESQLRAFFSGLMERNRAAHLEQITLRPASAATGTGANVRQPGSIHPAIRTAVKSVVICGLSQAAAKQLAATPIVRAIQHDLGMKVSFDVVSAARK